MLIHHAPIRIIASINDLIASINDLIHHAPIRIIASINDLIASINDLIIMRPFASFVRVCLCLPPPSLSTPAAPPLSLSPSGMCAYLHYEAHVHTADVRGRTHAHKRACTHRAQTDWGWWRGQL